MRIAVKNMDFKKEILRPNKTCEILLQQYTYRNILNDILRQQGSQVENVSQKEQWKKKSGQYIGQSNNTKKLKRHLVGLTNR